MSETAADAKADAIHPMNSMTPQEYIAQIREELFELEGKLEQVELKAEQARQEIDNLAARRRRFVVDAMTGDEVADRELTAIDGLLRNARQEHERSTLAVSTLEEHIRALRGTLRGYMRQARLGVRED